MRIGTQVAMQTRVILTEDRKPVTVGDRVYNYYGCEWGTIDSEPDRDGWFNFRADGAYHTTLLNGQRISSYEPAWAKKYNKGGE